MLDRRQIAQRGVAPAVTPIVRIPPNQGQANWVATQVLDIGVYGIIWPHVDTVEDAYNAVAAMRYPRVEGRPLREPFGRRGDAPQRAVTYWGIAQQEYYARADVWPLFLPSKRRHTRCLSDWSSDVCSSDLAPPPAVRWPRARTLSPSSSSGRSDPSGGSPRTRAGGPSGSSRKRGHPAGRGGRRDRPALPHGAGRRSRRPPPPGRGPGGRALGP